MFLVPKVLPDGTRNALTLNRLKDKFGSRSMASAEVTYAGAVAYPVGDLARGFKQMMEMVNVSRLSNAMRSAALMRRALHEALTHARARVAFGRPLAELPLLRAQLVQMVVDTEAAASVVLHGASTLDRWDAGAAEARALFRITTPLAKYWITQHARLVTAEAMNVRGGNGYIEEWVNARLVRDSYLGAIWEGASNVVALDVQRAILREAAHEPLLAFAADRLRRVSEAAAKPWVDVALDGFEAVRRRVGGWPALARGGARAGSAAGGRYALPPARREPAPLARARRSWRRAATPTRSSRGRSICGAGSFPAAPPHPPSARARSSGSTRSPTGPRFRWPRSRRCRARADPRRRSCPARTPRRRGGSGRPDPGCDGGCRPADFTGEVGRGQRFERRIEGDLVFLLDPDPAPSLGWTIKVVRAPRDDEDYAAVVTPPHRGINARFIEGWHFRNPDNTGPNLGGVNTPPARRDFSFVVKREDYRAAADALDRLLWRRPDDTDQSRQRALEGYERAARGEGTLRIHRLDLGNLVRGQEAWIDYMGFAVALCLPAATP